MYIQTYLGNSPGPVGARFLTRVEEQRIERVHPEAPSSPPTFFTTVPALVKM